MSALMPIANGEFALDLIPDGDSFNVIASGLARSLGFREAFDLVRTIPEAEKGSELVRTPSGEQRVLYVTEAGFYRSLGQRQTARISDPVVRASVERFQSWVYGEVLPSLRRGASPTPVKIELTINALAELAHKEHVVPAAAKVLAFHRWHKTSKGVEAFVQLTIDLNLPGVEGGTATITALHSGGAK